MSKLSDELEHNLVKMINLHIGERLPANLPSWMIKEKIRPQSQILKAKGIGSLSHKNKTDVIIFLENSSPIKISAKLLSADYFGNWYGHTRFLEEFGEEAFKRMTSAATIWANNWAKNAVAPYIGVSICFGRRSGKTAQNFTDVFTLKDILTVAKGFGEGEAVANCLYVSNSCCNNILDLIDSLEEITIESVNKMTESFKIAYRPINPITEKSNRGKNIYTKFKPYYRLLEPAVIKEPQELFKLGEFVEIKPNKINHNHVLDELEVHYNIIIPRKSK